MTVKLNVIEHHFSVKIKNPQEYTHFSLNLSVFFFFKLKCFSLNLKVFAEIRG